jgi:hypothetical protein
MKLKLYSTCRRSHALNCQVTTQKKVNIGVYVSRCEVHILLRSFKHVIRKPVHPMRHLNEVQVARASLGLFVVFLWTSMSLRQLFTACGIATMGQASLQGGLDKVVDA